MRLSAILLSIFTMIFFMNCGQYNEFDAGDERFKSLADGQSIEVVTEDEMEVIANQGDSGIVTDNMDTNTGDGGVSSDDDDDDESMERPGNSGNRMGHNDSSDKEDRSRDKDKGQSCKDRLSDQMDNGERDGMFATPEEIAETEELLEAANCKKNSNGKMKFVWICHVPADDEEKEKSLCLPIPALAGHIINPMSRSTGKHHADYLGKCKSDQEDEGSTDDSSDASDEE